MSILEAAEKILRKAGKPLGVDELTRRIVAAGLWTPKTKTPSASVGSAIYIDMKNGGKTFAKTGCAEFALASKDVKFVNKVIKHKGCDSGYVYILTNPSFRKDWVKIGMTERPVNIRSKELDNTAVPLPFEIYATLKTDHRRKIEKLLHGMIDDFDPNRRIRKSREFFNINPETALRLLVRAAEAFDEEENILREFNKSELAPKTRSRKAPKKVAMARRITVDAKGLPWSGKTQLSKLIAAHGGNLGSFGHILLTLSRKRRCPKDSKWRAVLEEAGLKFDKEDMVVDCSKANNPVPWS